MKAEHKVKKRTTNEWVVHIPYSKNALSLKPASISTVKIHKYAFFETYIHTPVGTVLLRTDTATK